MRNHILSILSLILLIALIVCSGCAPKEEAATGETPSTKETPTQPSLTQKYTNEMERWNGYELFYKNKWVDEAVKLVDDKDADKGKAIMYPSSAGEPKMAGYMNRGPYTVLEPGRYVFIFRIKVADNQFPNEKPVYFDIEATNNISKQKGIATSKVLLGSDFEKNQWSDQYTLSMEVKEPTTVEVRVKPSIAVDTYLDYIALVKQ